MRPRAGRALARLESARCSANADRNAQLSRLADNPIARVVAYYILLFAADRAVHRPRAQAAPT